MVYLTKEQSLFARDGKGNLLPIEVVLDILEDKPTVKIIPLTKGEMREIQEISKDLEKAKTQDDKIILEHCVEPKYDEDEVKHIKPIVAGAIMTGILSISTGLSQEDVRKTTAKALSPDFLSKK